MGGSWKGRCVMGEKRNSEKLVRDPEFLAEYMKGSLAADIEEAMEELGISQSELAARLGKSRQYVGKVLKEENLNNFTIDSIAKIAAALERDVVLRLKRDKEIVEIKPFRKER